MNDAMVDLRWQAMRQCDRILSGTRPQTLAQLTETLSRSSMDLDGRPDFYGDGPVGVLEDRVAALLGKPAAVFFPTGTMAQQVALRCWARRSGNQTVALHPLGHLDTHERAAYSTLTGLRSVWTTMQPRPPTALEILSLDEPFGTLLLELPLREAGFVLPRWDELVAVVEAARLRGARIHFDGARLWEATGYLGQDLATIAALADSVYVSFYKTIGAISGAVLAAGEDLAAEARAWRHRYGGQLFQQWPAALSALAGLETQLPLVPSYVTHAATVAAALATLPGASVYPRPPHTHQFQLWLPYEADRLNDATMRLANERKTWFCGGWTDMPAASLAWAEITVAEPALAWTASDIVAAGQVYLTYLDG